MAQNTQDDKIKGTARIVVMLAWVGGLVFLTYLFQQFIDDRYNPNTELAMVAGPNGVREVVLLRNAQGHYVASGRINNEDVTFLLDTGATDVAIPGALADRLGLPRLGRGMSRTANGTVPVWGTRLDSVQLGAVLLRDVRATILPSMERGAPVLLGMSFLKQLEMVQREGRLTLRQGATRG
jgi:aspartyl protease family protein